MKTVKNVTATALFPAGSVLPAFPHTIKRNEGESDEDYAKREREARQRISAASRMADGEEREKEYSELSEMLLPEMATQLKHLGARLPSDPLSLSVTLGNFLFDLYMLSVKQPSGAPLMQALYTKRIQDLAERCSKDEVALKPEEITVVRIGLEDEKVWDTVKVSAFIEVTDAEGKSDKRYVVLNSKAAPYFQQVVNAAVEYVVSHDQQEASNS